MATTNKKRIRTKSSISTARPRNYSDLYKNEHTVPQPAAAAPVAKTTEARYAPLKGSDTVDWKHEYAYVLNDLRMLLIVSAILIAIIVVVGLFL